MEVAATEAADGTGTGTAYFFKLSCRSLESVVSRAEICAEFGCEMGKGAGVVGDADPLLSVVEDEGEGGEGGEGDGVIDGSVGRKVARMKD